MSGVNYDYYSVCINDDFTTFKGTTKDVKNIKNIHKLVLKKLDKKNYVVYTKDNLRLKTFGGLDEAQDFIINCDNGYDFVHELLCAEEFADL